MSDDINDKRIEHLIDIINQKTSYSPTEDTPVYEELLWRSLESGHLYGQSLAYIKLSRIYQNVKQTQYFEFIKKAFDIAEKQQYLDVLVRYYNLEGIRHMQNYDEANALSMYLKGIQVTLELSDHRLSAIFYNNIAEIFYNNDNYDKAILYYEKALYTLDLISDDDVGRYRKAITENLISSYYHKQDIYNIKKYLQLYNNITCDDSIRPFAKEEADLRVLMLENKADEVVSQSIKLFNDVKNSEINISLLFYAYAFLCDIFLDYKMKYEALFCLTKLDQMKMTLSQKYIIDMQKRKIRYCEIFDIDDNSVYKEFYKITLTNELNNTKAISNSLSSAVSLYEREKEKRLIQKEHEGLEELVMHDSLTRVYNRRKHDQIVKECLSRNDVKEIAYVMIDIDYFKEYNDYYGHSKGDAILKLVSSLIQELLPDSTYLGRYGGDEFACLLINKTIAEVDEFIKSIHNKVNEIKIVHIKSKNQNHITLSLGVYYTSHKENTTIDVLIKNADDALYQVKKNGRNGYVLLLDS